MIGVVLAAGRGTRLAAPLPKPLVRVAGVAAIDRVLGALFDDGFSDVVVVTGFRGNEVEDHISSAHPGVRFCSQVEPVGTADAVLAARDAVGDAPFLLSWADVIVPRGTHRDVANAASGLDGAVAINHLDDRSSGGAVTVGHGRVSGIVEKPEPLPGWNLTGVLALSPGIWEHIETLEPSVRGEYEVPEAVDAWITAGAEIAAVPIEGPVFEIGTPSGLAEADAYLSADTRDR